MYTTFEADGTAVREFLHPVNPELPPLPLTDGCMFIDNTTIEYLITCARSAQYYLLHKRRIAEQKSALFFGGAIHSALEYRYANAGIVAPAEIPKGQNDLLSRLFEQSPVGVDDYRNLSLATEIIRVYNQTYATEEFRIITNGDKPLVEQAFAIELFRLKVPTWVHSSGELIVIYTGRIDLLVEWDGLFNVDHKTTSIMGAGFFEEQSMSPQQEGYMWAVQKTLGVLPQGYVINAIRTRPPAKTRDAVTSEDFVRQKFPCPAERVTEWEYNITQIITEFVWKYIRGYLPMEKKWCIHKYGRCQYFDVCTLPKENRLMLLDSGMYADNTWSPLTSAQTIAKAGEAQTPEKPRLTYDGLMKGLL
jgi:hypothetical protein